MKKIISLMLSVVMMMGITPLQTITNAADSSADNPEYAYFMNTAENSAYVWLGEKIEGEGIKFYDGQQLGIEDKKDPLYNETVTLDGLTARKQYSANSSYFKLDEKYYDKGDNEFLISLVFYDFGPSEGKFYFEYHSTDGTIKQITIIKPGTNPGWLVKTMCMDDVDLETTYENGAHFRIKNGAYNAFKKLEIVNVSKAKREKTTIATTCLGVEVKNELESLRIIKSGDERFLNKNLGSHCTGTDANDLRNIITGTTNPDTYQNNTITQGELLQMYLQSLNLTKREGESWVDAARRWGVTDAMDYFLFDETPATYFNLINLVYSALVYENSKGDILLANLIKNGFYEGVEVINIKSDAFQTIYYSQPRKLPKKKIINSQTGRTYYHINLFGNMLLRGYTDSVTIMHDGSGMICGTAAGDLYHYDFETEMLTYLDKTIPNTAFLAAYCCPNGWVYYLQRANSITTLLRINPLTLEKEVLMELPVGFSPAMYITTNDGRYASFECYSYGNAFPVPAGTTPVIRADLVEKKLIYTYYGFDYAHYLNHHQINPVYPDIIAFSHEFSSGMTGWDIYDRCYIMDITTGKVAKYNSGRVPDGRSAELVSHEVWGMSGDYRYFTASPLDSSVSNPAGGSVVRVDLNGRHRQYYSSQGYNSSGNHVGVSGDERMIAFDGCVSLQSTETHQVFPIVYAGRKNYIGSGHPYHPHPHLSYTGNILTWGEVDNNVLGISWMDYTDILENEVAKGGRYAFGDDVVIPSYKGIECESRFTTKMGKDCVTANIDKEVFFDINPEIIDVDNGAAKITFDYFDNGSKPLVMTYTKGVEEQNDALQFFNKQIKIPRKGTNKWRTAEVIINCGNFESIGKFESDFKIYSGEKNVYIANVRVEAIEKK